MFSLQQWLPTNVFMNSSPLNAGETSGAAHSFARTHALTHACMHATPTCIPLLLFYAFIMNVLSSMTDVIYSGSSAFLVLPAFLRFLLNFAGSSQPPSTPPPTPSLVSIAGVCADPSDLFSHSCRGCLTEDVRQGLRVGSPDRARPPWTDARGVI